jgi:Fe-S cluster biogenesis protein NfuA/nitrite reductase/ring-hydroxylating ferredoxin subunit
VDHDASGPDWRSTGDRIDTLITASAAGGPVARERSEELVRLVTDFYGAGLERMLDLLHEQGRLDEQVLAALAADDLVASVLLVHGLHPYSVETRIEQALQSVRPYLGSHGGDVQLLGVSEEGVVGLRLLGSCDGCPSSSATLKLAVQGAVEAAAPEVTAIEVQTPAADRPSGPLVAVDALFARLREPAADDGASAAVWADAPELAALQPGGVTRLQVGGVPVLGCRIGADLFAFRDRCARCERPLEGAVLARALGAAADAGVLRCPACRAHYDVRRAGACLDQDADGLHLDPLPLLSDGAVVSVAVPAPVAT